ncbi:MAG: SAM-dependent methyltransferase [Bacteroidetes bacterium GWF2_40_14]|nr:MAG: SAM-dependent methyltransferase [Bacteroidetes bacterium GWF2_40_14]
MKIRNPYSKDSLSLKRSFRVLEVGPGSNPTRRANVLTERYVDDNFHRRGDFMLYPHQTLVQADGENLPFGDREFDYVICCHVLEHVDNPYKFMQEQFRVSKKGYIETPSLLGEFLAPKASHRWVMLEIDNKMVIYEKSKMPYKFDADYGDLFLNYLPYQSVPFRLLMFSRVNMTTVRIEWKDSLEILVNPEDEYYSSFFTKKWTPEMVRKVFPETSFGVEFRNFFKAFCHMLADKFSRAVSMKKGPVNFADYKK